MASIIERQQNFTGGMCNDPFKAGDTQFEDSRNLDIYYQVGRVRPYRGLDDISSGQSNVSTLLFGSTGKLYGLTDGLSHDIKLYEYDGSWSQLEDTNDKLNDTSFNPSPCFVEHQGYLYWYNDVTNSGDGAIVKIDRYKIADNYDAGDTNSVGDYFSAWRQFYVPGNLGSDRIPKPGPGFRHPISDKVFFAYGSYVYELDQYNELAYSGDNTIRIGFRVPEEYQIVTMTYWDKYLVIGCTANNTETDKVYFWDQLSPRADFVKEIPEGNLVSVRNMGGFIGAVCYQKDVDGLLMAYLFAGSEFALQASLIKRNITGDIKFYDTACNVKNNTMFFGGTYDDMVGIFRFGPNKYGQHFITLDRTCTTTGNEDFVYALEIDEDTFYTVSDNYGEITRTDNSANYSLSGSNVYLVTKRFDAGKRWATKKNIAVSIYTIKPNESYSSSGDSIDVYYRKDNETAWTLIGTHDASTYEASRMTFKNTEVNVQPYNTIQFKLEFTGLVQLAEFEVEHEIIKTALHDN